MRLHEDAILDVAEGDRMTVTRLSYEFLGRRVRLWKNPDIGIGDECRVRARYVMEGVQVAVLQFPDVMEEQKSGVSVPAREYFALARGLHNFLAPLKA